MLRTLIYTLLREDNGISEGLWEELTEYLQCQGEFELIGELTAKVKSCNGRRYVS